MNKLKSLVSYFTKFEIALWIVAVLLIVIPFFVFDTKNYMTLFVSILGITAIVFIAKGNPIGQMMMVVFGIIYALISYEMAYYGEMLTYIGMTVPMAVLSLISWLKNPFNNNRAQVKINTITKKDYILMSVLAVVVTIIFYFILDFFNTANIAVSTLSITTSFIAVFLSYKRSRFFALGYLVNDIVLITLWVLASIHDIKYVSVASCFVAFMFMDSYTFINWSRIKKQQAKHLNDKTTD